MILATLAVQSPRSTAEARDGRLVVVSPDHRTGAYVPDIPNLLAAIQDWTRAETVLRAIDDRLRAGKAQHTVDLATQRFMAPLPRTWAWIDGSAFLHHVTLVRKARNAELPQDLWTVPLVYQGASDNLLGPLDDIPMLDEAHGMDFEAEVGIVTDDVPLGTRAAEAARHVKLLLVMNDVSLRELVPRELRAGFGYFHSKPASSFAPFAVTPEEAGDAWRDGRLHLEMRSVLNGELFGRPNAGAMHFSFHDLIAHAARTRSLSAGTIVGSGTVSNEDETVGSSCIAERRMIEKMKTGGVATRWLRPGDSVEIEMLRGGKSLFGKISQRVVLHKTAAVAR